MHYEFIWICFLFQEQSPGDSKDFAILRFHAGPPYEVIYDFSMYNFVIPIIFLIILLICSLCNIFFSSNIGYCLQDCQP